MINEIDETHNKNLYKWKRHDNKLKSKIKDSDNIQSIHQWLRKVEEASDSAINNVLNPKVDKTKSNPNISNAGLSKKSGDPFSEAHDLINQWVTDKIRLDMDDDFYNYVDVNEMNKFTDNEKALDKLKAEIMRDNTDCLDICGIDYDKYDESYIAKDIVNKMMKKKVVDPKTLLYSDEKKPKYVDTQMKIELRHQAVKENRERRQRDLEIKRKEKLEKKEIELKAKQIVQKEERDKKMRQDIEQQLLEQEVQKLRIEMNQQRIKDEEMRRKAKEIEFIQSEREQQEMNNLQKKFEIANIESAMELKRNEMAEKRAQDLVDSYLKAKNMRLIQRAFSNWYGLILDLRLKNGKAKALADWRLSYKVFNSWKKISVTEKVKKEQELHQNLIKVENIKIVKAIKFSNFKILSKFFEEWRKFTRNELISKQIEYEKSKTKNKMQQFLEAAAEGKLWTERDNVQNESYQQPYSSRSTKKNALRKSKSFESLNDAEKPVKENSKTNLKLNKRKVLINREPKDIQDSKLSERSINESNVDSTRRDNDLNKKIKDMMWPFVKTPYAVNNFDNRFKAQEKMLHDQQRMIKDQQKIIDELKFQQSQVAFKEQIALLEQIKAKQLDLEKMQMLQYKQEKKMLNQQAINFNKKTTVKQNKSVAKEPTSIENDRSDFKDGDELSFSDQEILFENEKETNDTSKLKNDPDIISERSQATGPQTSRSNIAIAMSNNSSKNAFNKNMEERAKLREQMKREREEKRKKLETEKLEQLRVQQEEKLKVEEEERRKKNEELRIKRDMQRKLEEKRNSEKIKEQESLTKADAFYKKHLMRYYGMNGFKKLIELRRDQSALATKHFSCVIFRKVVETWRFSIRIDLVRRQQIADEFNRKLILKIYLNKFKLHKQCAQIASAKATRFYKYQIKLKLYEAWKFYTVKEKRAAIEYENLINEHNAERIKKKYFLIWKQFPGEMKRLKIRQKRIDELRSKVREMIPDYEVPGSLNTNASNSINNSIK